MSACFHACENQLQKKNNQSIRGRIFPADRILPGRPGGIGIKVTEMGNLKGKTAFVTGASQGIGAAVAEALIDAGCHIAMHYFHAAEEPERLKKTALENGQKAICLQADLTGRGSSACIREAASKLGTFDILVNNSGALVERRFIEQWILVLAAAYRYQPDNDDVGDERNRSQTK
jgi:hypothetical protein